MGYKWGFTIKYQANGSIDRCKARLVAKGLTQIYRIDNQETFALVANINSIQVLLVPCYKFELVNASNRHEECFSKWRARGGGLHAPTIGF